MYQNDPNLYLIHPGDLELLNEKAKKIARRAAKLSVPAPAFRVVDETTVTCSRERWGKLVSWEEKRLVIQVTGETPKLAGWYFVAKVEYFGDEKLVLCAPGETCPVEFRTRGMECDHCKTNRMRKTVIVLRHEDGHYVQVGRQCVCDFLGGVSPEAIIWGLESGIALMHDAEECEGGFGGFRAAPEFAALEFLAAAAIIIRRCGWISKGAAGDWKQSTAHLTWEYLNPDLPNAAAVREYNKWIEKNDLNIQERDRDLAVEALSWAKSIPANINNDYLYNLGVAARADFVGSRTSGIMASAIPAYMRHVERENELKKERVTKTRLHVGEIKKRQVFENLTITNMRYLDTDFGSTTLVIFEDETGNLIKWVASTNVDDFNVGDVVDVKATVKKHGDYKGVPETVINRAVLTRKIAV